MADIRQVRTSAHLTELHERLKNVIARRTPAVAPFALEIGATVIGPHLLGVTIYAAVRGVDLRTAQGHAGRRGGINIGALFVHLRIEAANLKIRHNRHSEPGEGEDAKNSEEKWLEPFH